MTPLETLRRSAVLEREGTTRLEAFAHLLGAPVRVRGAGATVDLRRVPDGGFALLAVGARVLFFVERFRPAPPLPGRRVSAAVAPEPPGHVDVRDDWTRGGEGPTGGSTMSTVPTLFEGTALFAPQIRHLRLRTEVDSAYYVVTPAMLEALAADPAWGPAAVSRMVERLQVDAVLATAPATRRSGARQRAAIGEEMTLRTVTTAEVLAELDAPAHTFFVVAGVGRVAVTRRTPAGEVTYELGYGAALGGEALAPLGGASSGVRLVAAEPTQVLALGRVAIERMLLAPGGAARERGRDWFRLFAASFREVDRQAPALVADLRALPVLGELGAEDLYSLLQGAELLRWRLNWPDPEPVNQVPGFGLVLEGELLRVGERSGRALGADEVHLLHPESAVRPGESFGVLDMVLGEPVGRVWQARTPAKVVFILRHRCLEVLDRVSLFLGRVLEARAAQRRIDEARKRILAAASGPAPAPVVLFQAVGTGSARPHLPGLLDAVRLAIAADFKERAVVIDLDGAADPAAFEARVVEARRAPDVRWVLATGPTAPALWPLCDRIVRVHADRCVPFGEPAPRRVPGVFTTILPADVSVSDAGPPSRNVFPPNRVRLTLSLAGAPRSGSAWYGQAPADFSRWARAVTDRRVGVALGGGGAWGYAHLAVLYQLEREGVPVDLISGASFGSVVGAFYAAEQRQGLLKLLKHGRAINRGTQAAFLTYVPLQRLIDRLLGGRRLEDLVVPFLPATTDVVSGSEDYVARGTLGEGVRASGGLSPMLPPTRTAFATWVDGGMVANVPAGVLRQEGARFVVSSNVVPPPESAPSAPLLPAWYGQVLADLNPVARMKAALASWMTAMATIGEYSASVADVQFDATLPRALPNNMEDGLAVLDNAVSNPAFWDALKSARDRWASLSGAAP